MEVAERKCSSSGYCKPPWIFKGSALYQLHLVKAETAKAFIPKEFKLVEAFGYTLGGFFLANYEDSPAGSFDELVVIAGIVWNPPTSCAWAARVLVSSDEACDHGRKEIGLPSYVAKFSKRISAVPRKQKSKYNQFLDKIGLSKAYSRAEEGGIDVQVTEISGSCATNICNINLASVSGWMGPEIKMSLPSFSGRTKHNFNLLKYSCNIESRVQAIHPAKVTGPLPETKHETEESMSQQKYTSAEDSAIREIEDSDQNLIKSVMLSKPILALKFNCLRMEVNAPTTVFLSCKNSTTSLGFP